jgi:hypothetical protein
MRHIPNRLKYALGRPHNLHLFLSLTRNLDPRWALSTLAFEAI